MRHVLIVLFREDKLDSHTWRVPLWALRAGAGVLGALVLLALLGVAFYGPVASTAARVPGLTREVDRLRAENTRVLELAAALDSVEAGYARLRAMVGADIAPDPAALTQRVFVAAPIVARLPGEQRYTVAPGIPAYWPLDDQGYVTRGTVDTTGVDEAHPGLDIAVREGTIVRATAGGTIVEAGDARDYGLYVLMRHAEGYESMYGHLSRILVQAGQVLPAGSALGLSGNTGRSTAPHLHFEIRRAGRPVDPATLVKEAP